MSVKPQVD